MYAFKCPNLEIFNNFSSRFVNVEDLGKRLSAHCKHVKIFGNVSTVSAVMFVAQYMENLGHDQNEVQVIDFHGGPEYLFDEENYIKSIMTIIQYGKNLRKISFGRSCNIVYTKLDKLGNMSIIEKFLTLKTITSFNVETPYLFDHLMRVSPHQFDELQVNYNCFDTELSKHNFELLFTNQSHLKSLKFSGYRMSNMDIWNKIGSLKCLQELEIRNVYESSGSYSYLNPHFNTDYSPMFETLFRKMGQRLKKLVLTDVAVNFDIWSMIAEHCKDIEWFQLNDEYILQYSKFLDCIGNLHHLKTLKFMRTVMKYNKPKKLFNVIQKHPSLLDVVYSSECSKIPKVFKLGKVIIRNPNQLEPYCNFARINDLASLQELSYLKLLHFFVLNEKLISNLPLPIGLKNKFLNYYQCMNLLT